MAGKIIVITGANGGLGSTLAQRLADDGEKLVLLGRTLSKVEKIAEKIGHGAIAIACDVTSPDSVRAAFAKIAQTYPKIDVLINNAAIFQPFLVHEASDAQIMGSVLTNLAGPILCTRSAIPMINKGGHIINLSSESIVEPFAHLSLYQSSKAGLETFSLHLKRELEDLGTGIRVTIVRAGQMYGPDSTIEMDPVAAKRFHEACVKRGMNFAARGITLYSSTVEIFRMLLDLPQDIQVGTLMFESRVPTQ
jgi:NAD(P)-dependent dehydrogenase (short-subunit alcohol dehydrogenase family)